MIETPLPLTLSQQIVATRKISRKNRHTNVTLSRWSLPLILVFQGLASWILLKNTVFQDEALYLYAGEQIWHHWTGGPATDTYSYFFSGYPYVYPIIGGMLNMIGGLELARSFSTICMFVVTASGYYVTKKLFNQKSATYAALFFSFQGPVLFLSRLATYDPLCLCFLALATALAVNASQAQRPWRALGIGPLLVLAFGAKYAALLFMPSILAILIGCTWIRQGGVSSLRRGMLGVLSLIVVGTLTVVLVLHLDPAVIHAVWETTANRTITQVNPRLTLTEHIIAMVGFSFLVGLVGLLFARKKSLLIALLLLSSALLVPAYHIYKGELISLDKHLGFSMFFVMPVAGYALASLSGYQKVFSSERFWLSSMAICLMLFLIGVPEAQAMYASWPPTTALTYMLNTQVRPSKGRYLAEQFEVSRYNLQNDTYNWQWTGLDFFEYTDKQGHYYSGNDAYIHAINDGYFDLIQLNYGYNRSTAFIINAAIQQSNKYDLIDKIPYQSAYGVSYFWVWRKR